MCAYLKRRFLTGSENLGSRVHGFLRKHFRDLKVGFLPCRETLVSRVPRFPWTPLRILGSENAILAGCWNPRTKGKWLHVSPYSAFRRPQNGILNRSWGFRWGTNHFGDLNKREHTSREIIHSKEMGTGERIFGILMAWKCHSYSVVRPTALKMRTWLAVSFLFAWKCKSSRVMVKC